MTTRRPHYSFALISALLAGHAFAQTATRPVQKQMTPSPVAPAATPISPPSHVAIPLVPQAPNRWFLRPEAPPSIAPNSEVLLFVHGMDSRAEEADDITNALFRVLAATARIQPPAAWPPIAANIGTASFNGSEPCDHPDQISNGQRIAVVPFDVVNGVTVPLYFGPMIPPQLLDSPPPPGTQINLPAAHNIGANEGRLRSELRSAAAAAEPREPLRKASFRFAAGDVVWGNAYADLTVTGRRAFANFRQLMPGDPFCQWVVGTIPPLGTPPVTPAAVLNGCRTALDRAYRVANFLRTGQRGDTPALKAAKRAERNALGWIAVSGEDDSPHRPVNVPSSDYPQYDLVVRVQTPFGPPPFYVDVHTRYTIAQSGIAGRNLVVISVDLPTSGYADNLNYNLISPLVMIGSPKITPNPLPIPVVPPIDAFLGILGVPPGTPVIPPGFPIPDFQATGATPLLDFIEQFVVNFASTLDNTVPFKNNIKAVMGGSLGGNMTFRLGRRPNVPWLPQFVVWSPASIWDSLGGGADFIKHQGPLSAWKSANQAMTTWGPGDRAAFFGSWDRPIVPIIVPQAQSDTWTSDHYLCKKSMVAAARLDRQETFDPMFLGWHWRLGAEQLLYSHQNKDASGQPLYMSNHKPMLLACGQEDQVPFNDICPATEKTAPHMLTPGKAVYLAQTGHSLDNERRTYWAQQVIAFLGL